MSGEIWTSKDNTGKGNVLIWTDLDYKADKNEGGSDDAGDVNAKELVEAYLNAEGNGELNEADKFFSDIVKAFGYGSADRKEFFDKIFFGFYDSEKDKASNNDLFEIVNKYDIDTVVVLGKSVFDSLPDNKETEEKVIGIHGLKFRTKVKAYISCYSENTAYDTCDVKLNAPVKVYGINHPYDGYSFWTGAIHNFLKDADGTASVCK